MNGTTPSNQYDIPGYNTYAEAELQDFRAEVNPGEQYEAQAEMFAVNPENSPVTPEAAIPVQHPAEAIEDAARANVHNTLANPAVEYVTPEAAVEILHQRGSRVLTARSEALPDTKGDYALVA